ncbi:MAG: ATP-binding protein, partial [Bacteriovoracales bacterium]|nr:ATP-binding protein [Bacteriovoracales bacterium]
MKRVLFAIAPLFLLVYVVVLIALGLHFYRLEEKSYSNLSNQTAFTIKGSVMAKDEVAVRMILLKILEGHHLLGVKVHVSDMEEMSYFQEQIEEKAKVFNFPALLFSKHLRFDQSYNIYPNSNEKYQISFFYENLSRQEILALAMIVTLAIFLLALVIIIKYAKMEQKSKRAEHIFHTARSDVLQVESILGEYPMISREHRILIKDLTQSILAAAAQFIKGGKKTYAHLYQKKIFNIAEFIEGIIALKKLECKDNGIRFIFNKNKSNDFITLKSIRQELRSAISHVINNSIEALNGKGSITFDLSLNGNLAKITISDDGPGVPQDKISEIVKEGKSYNKKFGNGLGLPQCIETIESLG